MASPTGGFQMYKLGFAALIASTMISGAAQAASVTYDSLSAWQAAAGPYSNDIHYGANRTDISGLTLDDGTQLSFGSPINIRNINNGWGSWSGGYTGQVLFTESQSFTINFDTAIDGFGFFIESNMLAMHNFTLALSDGSTVSGSYHGDSGAGFLGFIGSGVTSATITGTDFFAVGDFYVAKPVSVDAVPEPASWALMIGGFGLVGGALRRRKAVAHAA